MDLTVAVPEPDDHSGPDAVVRGRNHLRVLPGLRVVLGEEAMRQGASEGYRNLIKACQIGIKSALDPR